jgi:hypothetical protein
LGPSFSRWFLFRQPWGGDTTWRSRETAVLTTCSSTGSSPEQRSITMPSQILMHL